jgi:hypothetical protein
MYLLILSHQIYQYVYMKPTNMIHCNVAKTHFLIFTASKMGTQFAAMGLQASPDCTPSNGKLSKTKELSTET